MACQLIVVCPGSFRWLLLRVCCLFCDCVVLLCVVSGLLFVVRCSSCVVGWCLFRIKCSMLCCVLFVACWLLDVVRGLLRVARSWLRVVVFVCCVCVVSWLARVVCVLWLLVVGCLLIANCWLLCVDCCALIVVYGLLVVLCCVLVGVWGSSCVVCCVTCCGLRVAQRSLIVHRGWLLVARRCGLSVVSCMVCFVR